MMRKLIKTVMIGGGVMACTPMTGCGSTKDLGYAAAAPLRDLNIGTRPVPERLGDLRNPYGTDTQTSCAAIYNEAKAISNALTANNRRHAGTRQDSAMGNVSDVAVETAATYWIPFRGLIRQISGAAGRERKAIAADARGRERLGFLIGRGSALRCRGFELPAAPMQQREPMRETMREPMRQRSEPRQYTRPQPYQQPQSYPYQPARTYPAPQPYYGTPRRYYRVN